MARIQNFKFNPGFFGQLGNSPAVVAIVVGKANAVAAVARSTAPVGETGRYKAGIKVSTRKAAYRTVAVVTATDEKSLIIESKTGNLAKALKAGKGA